ncbi:cytochrome P450 [Rhodocollybia butyracea]|uniref:Cytochrome P450 n=1 Tax=Rhodocollybia butyracea TaxID=206335 RepID=A0A9P5PQM5_9AGAR|nr:cytochrome P450 [Rhodocollybia butyracea]
MFPGDLVYIRERNMLITNSSQVAIDLLGKRTRVYSDREESWTTKLCGGERIITFFQHSNKWRSHRKIFNEVFRRSTINRFYPAQYAKVLDLLHSLVATPEHIMQHTMALSQSLMYVTLYGLHINYDDPIARGAAETVDIFGRVFLGGFPTLERYPWLRFMPSFFPGCGFKQIANDLGKKLDDLDILPFERAVNNLKTGTGTSVIAELVLRNEEKPAVIKIIKEMGTASLIAASDTTMSSISSFLLIITLHPDIQVKGQAEIDRVIGRDRLPTFEDRQSLPYVEAIYQEIMRISPPVPLGISHVASEDDSYMGYHIPKGFSPFSLMLFDVKLSMFLSGCTVVPNIWAMNRDPNLYSEPDKFIPERFLDSPSGPFKSVNDIYAYGFGRRVCPGRYIADTTVWLTIAYVLATLDLRKAKDNEGNDIDIPGDFTKTFFRHPMPYISSILPRDAQARDLISATAELK